MKYLRTTKYKDNAIVVFEKKTPYTKHGCLQDFIVEKKFKLVPYPANELRALCESVPGDYMTEG